MTDTTPITCALVDDHEVVRAGTRARLEGLDWLDVVAEASSVVEARAMLARSRPGLILMDVRLPDGSGFDLAREWLEATPSMRVVLFSGSATTRQAEEALESGVAGFVLKDSSLTTLVDALAAARDGRRYLDPTIAAEMLAPTPGTTTTPLSPRELEILVLMADGMQNTGIAHQLGVSTETVKAHVSNVLAKFGVDGRTEAVAKALRSGLID